VRARQGGEIVPGLFAALGLDDVQVYINDKAALLLPPYATPEQRAFVEESMSFAEDTFWSPEETRRYFLAGGGDEQAFDACYRAALELKRRKAEALRAGTYADPGGSVMYLVSGTKPGPAALE
jgi:hypothetical protein